MTRTIAILRPAPGNADTAARVRAAGLTLISLPLFETRPLPWSARDPARFDGLLLTSANAIRHGGVPLAAWRHLPVLAVGAATAEAARNAGFTIAMTGASDVATLIDGDHGFTRLLWLAGRERTQLEHPVLSAVIPVYASDALTPDLTPITDTVVLLHSTRAALHLAALIDRHGIDRARIRIAAISRKVVDAAGTGWAAITVADVPNDDALIAAARTLAIDP